jgi:hypothetical protein
MTLPKTGTARLSFAERKSWALKRGNPLWLWPEVSQAEWLLALGEIERACSSILAGQRAAAISSDAVALGLAAYTSGTGPLLGYWVTAGLLPITNPRAEKSLLEQLRCNGERMSQMLSRAATIVRLFARKRIAVTVLKGVHTAIDYFPDPPCRPMSDIDLLVALTDGARSRDALARAGFRQISSGPLETTWREHCSVAEPVTAISIEPGDPWAIDLHISLDVLGPPGASRARLSRLSANSVSCAHLSPARKLVQPGLLLHLAAHAGSGFHNLTLLRLVELVLVARADTKSGALEWNEWLEQGRRADCLGFAYPSLHLARRVSPADIPQAVVDACAEHAPAAVRRLVTDLSPSAAHRIHRPTVREHYAWTSGAGGWVRRLAADLAPVPGSLRRSAAIQAARARGLLNAALG